MFAFIIELMYNLNLYSIQGVTASLLITQRKASNVFSNTYKENYLGASLLQKNQI